MYRENRTISFLFFHYHDILVPVEKLQSIITEAHTASRFIIYTLHKSQRLKKKPTMKPILLHSCKTSLVNRSTINSVHFMTAEE